MNLELHGALAVFSDGSSAVNARRGVGGEMWSVGPGVPPAFQRSCLPRWATDGRTRQPLLRRIVLLAVSKRAIHRKRRCGRRVEIAGGRCHERALLLGGLAGGWALSTFLTATFTLTLLLAKAARKGRNENKKCRSLVSRVSLVQDVVRGSVTVKSLRRALPAHNDPEKVAAAHLDHVLCRSDKRHRVQPRIERAADHAFPAHRRRDGHDGDGGADPRQRARHAT